DANVRVISSYVGGGFGTKSAPHTDEALAAMLARKARLPVKLQYTREEEILDSNTRFETKIYIRLGVKKDMTLHALDVKAYINQGAYHTRLGGLGNQSTHMYKAPHVRTVGGDSGGIGATPSQARRRGQRRAGSASPVSSAAEVPDSRVQPSGSISMGRRTSSSRQLISARGAGRRSR